MLASASAEHLLAIGMIGGGALLLINDGHYEAGAAILGALGGYVLKNGVMKK